MVETLEVEFIHKESPKSHLISHNSMIVLNLEIDVFTSKLGANTFYCYMNIVEAIPI